MPVHDGTAPPQRGDQAHVVNANQLEGIMTMLRCRCLNWDHAATPVEAAPRELGQPGPRGGAEDHVDDCTPARRENGRRLRGGRGTAVTRTTHRLRLSPRDAAFVRHRGATKTARSRRTRRSIGLSTDLAPPGTSTGRCSTAIRSTTAACGSTATSISRRELQQRILGRAEMVFGDGDGDIFTDFTGVARRDRPRVDARSHRTHRRSGVPQPVGRPERVDVGRFRVAGQAVGADQTAAEADWLIGADVFTPSTSTHCGR